MKCIRCGRDNNYQERQNQICKQCGHEFVFEPKTMNYVKMTDGLFEKILSNISFDNSIFYTQKQFYYYLDKTIKNRQAKNFIWISISTFIFFNIWFTVFFGGFSSFIFGNNSFVIAWFLFNIIYVFSQIKSSFSSKINFQKRSAIAKVLLIVGSIILTIGTLIALILIRQFSSFFIITLLGVTSICFGVVTLQIKTPLKQTFVIEKYQLEKWQNRWNRINGFPEKLLLPTDQQNQNLLTNSELTNYSFDHLIICQTTNIANFLITNNFHLENNCAILSFNGYPQNIFQTVLNMAKQNSNLKVYALHNCSFKGISLVHYLRTRPNWFLNCQVQIYDLGLSYQQVMKLPNAFLRQYLIPKERQLPFEVRENLSPEEIKWFEAGNYVELESFSPKFLLKVVKKGIIKTNQITLDKEELPNNWQESDTEYSGTALIVFSADSFG